MIHNRADSEVSKVSKIYNILVIKLCLFGCTFVGLKHPDFVSGGKLSKPSLKVSSMRRFRREPDRQTGMIVYEALQYIGLI